MTQKLTTILTPKDHQYMIDLFSRKLQSAGPVETKSLLKKIQWHAQEYVNKTGQLPK